MFIVTGIIASLIISAIQIYVSDRQNTAGRTVWLAIKNGFVITLLSLAVLKLVLHYEHFVVTNEYGPMDFVKFFVIALIVGGIYAMAQIGAQKYLCVDTKGIKLRKGSVAVRVTSVVLAFMGFLCVFATDWAKMEYGDLPADQILITYFSPTTGSSMINYTDVVEGPLFMSVFLATIFGLFVFSKFKPLRHDKGNTGAFLDDTLHRILSLVLAIAIIAGGLGYGFYRFKVNALYNGYFSISTFIDEHYVDPRDANLQFPEKKRNLIHIYLESMENTYMSKDLGGFMDVNLIPELTKLATEGYSFSHCDDKFGGPQNATGTTWSVASMVNMSAGLPMKTPNAPNSYGSEGNFLPGAYTMGEILADQGYEQSLMFGADADFGGLTYYFKSHGNVKIMDYKYALKHDMIPSDYNVWWGFEDDKLFDFAKDEITRLSETGKPFSFVMETADTHRPLGYLSPKAPTPYEHQYANVVAYSSSQVYNFVRWIQQQPFYENTTVVIVGDHLSMETDFFEFYKYDESVQRSQYNVILNPAPGTASREKDILFNRIYANYDMFPTILTSMGVTFDGSRLGLGTDLFSGEKTLFEEFGFETADKEMQKMSYFYNDNILSDPKNR